MSKLKEVEQRVRKLLADNALVVREEPSTARITVNDPNMTNWHMRMGDPANDVDWFADGLGEGDQGKHLLWLDAEDETKNYLAGRSV